MSNKINLDKYYTPIDIAKRCIDKTYDIIGINNISEVIEPSAGNGSFSLQIDNCIAYDIEPEHETIIFSDFLELDIEYKKGRLFIGNPPFGVKMKLAQDFFKKQVILGDYIAMILPISQLWNSNSLYEFDLIYSEDLGKLKFSDRNLHCCFNIYIRPKDGKLKSKSKLKLDSVKIIRQDSKSYNDVDYDIRMCYWGQAAGKILKDYDKSYAGEYKIQISDEFRDSVINVLNNVNWEDELNCIAMPKIQQFHIIKVLKKYITNIK